MDGKHMLGDLWNVEQKYLSKLYSNYLTYIIYFVGQSLVNFLEDVSHTFYGLQL